MRGRGRGETCAVRHWERQQRGIVRRGRFVNGREAQRDPAKKESFAERERERERERGERRERREVCWVYKMISGETEYWRAVEISLVKTHTLSLSTCLQRMLRWAAAQESTPHIYIYMRNI